MDAKQRNPQEAVIELIWQNLQLVQENRALLASLKKAHDEIAAQKERALEARPARCASRISP
jgi:hypothetical protein